MFYRFFILILLFPTAINAQHFYRIKADFSFKFKGNEEVGSSLFMGTAYFDKIEKKITYRVKFPQPEVWVIKDTSMYKFRNQEFIEKTFVPAPVETSIFNLSLQSNLSNYGLESSAFRLEDVVNEDGLIIATWIPPVIQGNKQLGKVLIANKDGMLKGVVFKNDADEVIGKQFYDDYTIVNGIFFPQEIIQIMYDENGNETYQLTNYKNVIIDESGEDHWYRYPVDEY